MKQWLMADSILNRLHEEGVVPDLSAGVTIELIPRELAVMHIRRLMTVDELEYLHGVEGSKLTIGPTEIATIRMAIRALQVFLAAVFLKEFPWGKIPLPEEYDGQSFALRFAGSYGWDTEELAELSNRLIKVLPPGARPGAEGKMYGKLHVLNSRTHTWVELESTEEDPVNTGLYAMVLRAIPAED